METNAKPAVNVLQRIAAAASLHTAAGLDRLVVFRIDRSTAAAAATSQKPDERPPRKSINGSCQTANGDSGYCRTFHIVEHHVVEHVR